MSEIRPEITSAVTQLTGMLDSFNRAEEYYNGESNEVYASISVQKLLNKSGFGNVNWASIAVDAVLDRLEINATTSTDVVQQEAIDLMWKKNKLGLHARDIHQSALSYGETYVIVWGDTETQQVSIRHQSPKTTRVFYDPSNPDVVTHAIKSWLTVDGFRRADMYYADRVESWISATKATTGVPIAWSIVEDEEGNWPIENPFSQVPVFCFRTSPNAKPEHYKCFGPQDNLNKLVSTYSVSIDFNAFPQTVILSEDNNSSNDFTKAQRDFEEPGPGLDDSSTPEKKLVASPNSAWILDNVKDIKQLSAASPDGYIAGLEFFIKAMAEVSNTPIFLYQGGGSYPSGEARRMAEAPLNKKVETRQLYFGETWEQIFIFALSILGYATTEDDISVTWKSTQMVDDIETWQIVAAKIAIGISKRIALMEAGYSSEAVDAMGYTVNAPNGSTAVTEPPVASEGTSTDTPVIVVP